MNKVFARPSPTAGTRYIPPSNIELTCHADSIAALRAAVDNGADCVRFVYRARGEAYDLSTHTFQRSALKKGIGYAFQHGCRVCLDLDGHDLTGDHGQRVRAILNHVFECGLDEVSVASPALILYLRVHHPRVCIHFAASEECLNRRALMLAKTRLGIGRVLLPRVFSVEQLRGLTAMTDLELEMYGSGAGCAVITARRPGSSVPIRRWNSGSTESVPIASANDECACNNSSYAQKLGEMKDALALLPELRKAGVRGLVVEARDGTPAQMAQLTRAWRDALDQGQSPMANRCRLVSPRPG